MNKYSVAVAFADQGKPDYSLALANRLVFNKHLVWSCLVRFPD